ncbi:hypothetical protein ACFFWB_26900 [Flavobacterium procerum]|uniref:hypothetical protein n=1 Tax=Flavobacterium procerum TaxID=1455569 RepID=UPI0035EB2538
MFSKKIWAKPLFLTLGFFAWSQRFPFEKKNWALEAATFISQNKKKALKKAVGGGGVWGEKRKPDIPEKPQNVKPVGGKKKRTQAQKNRSTSGGDFFQASKGEKSDSPCFFSLKKFSKKTQAPKKKLYVFEKFFRSSTQTNISNKKKVESNSFKKKKTPLSFFFSVVFFPKSLNIHIKKSIKISIFKAQKGGVF